MTRTTNSRHVLGTFALAILAILVAFNLGGCSSDDTLTATPTAKAPQLPDPETLQFDFSFFAPGADLEQQKAGQYDNFVNAYLRAVVLQAMAELTLAAPVTVFAVALHTDPMAQPDGSWVWTYAWQDAQDSGLITLTGLPTDGMVEWELKLSGNIDGQLLDNAVWFTGTTDDGGDTGHWYFNDLETAGHPLSGEIAWGSENGGRFLRFISREEGEDGNSLTFSDNDPDFSIEFSDVASEEIWHIRWNADGSGSLRVPLYNSGEDACWDTRQRNADCS